MNEDELLQAIEDAKHVYLRVQIAYDWPAYISQTKEEAIRIVKRVAAEQPNVEFIVNFEGDALLLG